MNTFMVIDDIISRCGFPVERSSHFMCAAERLRTRCNGVFLAMADYTLPAQTRTNQIPFILNPSVGFGMVDILVGGASYPPI